MASWRIETDSGLDDWIYWYRLVKSHLITIDYNSTHSVFSRTVFPWLSRTRSILILFYDWLLICYWTTYIVSRQTIENTPIVPQRIYGNYIESTSSSVVVFTARCVRTEIIRLLLPYSMSLIVEGFTQQRPVYQESVSAGTGLSSRCLAVGRYVTIRLEVL
jgi:hypothetical protein